MRRARAFVMSRGRLLIIFNNVEALGGNPSAQPRHVVLARPHPRYQGEGTVNQHEGLFLGANKRYIYLPRSLRAWCRYPRAADSLLPPARQRHGGTFPTSTSTTSRWPVRLANINDSAVVRRGGGVGCSLLVARVVRLPGHLRPHGTQDMCLSSQTGPPRAMRGQTVMASTVLFKSSSQSSHSSQRGHASSFGDFFDAYDYD
jgi:hypothetical protein